MVATPEDRVRGAENLLMSVNKSSSKRNGDSEYRAIGVEAYYGVYDYCIELLKIHEPLIHQQILKKNNRILHSDLETQIKKYSGANTDLQRASVLIETMKDLRIKCSYKTSGTVTLLETMTIVSDAKYVLDI